MGGLSVTFRPHGQDAPSGTVRDAYPTWLNQQARTTLMLESRLREGLRREEFEVGIGNEDDLEFLR